MGLLDERENFNLHHNSTNNMDENCAGKMEETTFSPVFKPSKNGMIALKEAHHSDDELNGAIGCRQGWKNAFREFTQNTTLHGLRYIMISDTYAFRRLLWLVFLLAGSGIMCFQIIDRIITYYDWPVNVNVEVNFNKSLMFPAVTICNQNSFRATSAAAAGRYRLIEELYSSGPEAVDLEKFGAENITLDDLYLRSAHRKEDLVVECLWDGAPCSAANFTMVETDHGVCYTFTSHKTSLEVNSAGSENGLHLTLNIEQYEYMPGPHGAAGVKIFMHDRDDTPLVGELGFAIPAGSHSFVGNSLLVIDNLRPPYGECGEKKLKYFDRYSSANCKLDCLTRFVEDMCGCRDFFMPNIEGSPPVCTLEQKYSCMLPALRDFKDDDISICGICYVPCWYKVYQPILSYATVSNFVIDKLLANVDSEILGQKFMAAKEITHRMEENKFQRYKRLVKNVQGKFEKVESLLLEDIPDKFEYLQDKILKHRTNIDEAWSKKFYIYRYQEYLIQKNFIRGRDAMEERTLASIANGFQKYSLDTEQKIELLADKSMNDSGSRFLIFEMLINSFDVEEEMIQRAIENSTTLIESFRNGTQIFTYKFYKTPRSRNVYAVPRPLLNFALRRNWNARNYGVNVPRDLEIYKGTFEEYRRIVKQVYESGAYNATELKMATGQFFKYSKRYYHNKANLYFESIDWVGQEITKRKNEFTEMKSDLDNIFLHMQSNINSLKASLENVRETILDNLAKGCNMAQEYLTNSSVSKLQVSEALTSPDIHEGINTMKVFLQEVRSRGQNIVDDWTKVFEAASKIWTTILDDEDSFEYYNHMNMTDFLKDKKMLIWKLELAIVSTREYGDLRDVIQNRGRIFLKSLYDIMDESEDFKKTTTLDGRFLRDNFVFLNIYYSELSYEQITQQEGYGLFPLLCDIGGSMGLFIGASALTLFEIIDLFVNQTFVEIFRPRKKRINKPTRV